MKTIRTPSEMQQAAHAWRREGRSIGLVPTMGFLHDGHLSLMRIARSHADLVVVSIFVNPTQFGPKEDLAAYPRDLVRDTRLCRQEKVDAIFHPDASSMYASDHSVYVEDSKLARGLCGATRPGHFRGVTTVVAKLFNVVLPDVAVFGEKDAQQLRIIRRMARDLNFPVQVLSGKTIREPDGLAVSSRNVLLTPGERKEALCLRRTLDVAENLYREGERNTDKIKRAMTDTLAAAKSAHIDYIGLVDDETLEPIEKIDRPCLAAIAVQFSATRLIDNTVLGGR